MAVSDAFLTFVIEQLDGVRQITSRRMFGGVGLYSAEWFFGVLDNDRLYLKVDDSNVDDYTAAGTGPFRPYPDQTMTMKYYEVPVSVLEDRDALATWARKAIAVAEGAKGARGAGGSRDSKGSRRAR